MSDEPAHPLVRLAGWVRLGLLKELSGPAQGVLVVLACYASKQRAQAFPAVSTIARLTGRSRTRIFEALKLLQVVEAIVMTGRVKRRGTDAWGPTMYGIANPPSPEKFQVLVHRLRTHRYPKGVPQRRTHRSERDEQGRLIRASRPPAEDGQPSTIGGRPPSTNGVHPRPPAEDTDRVLIGVLEGEEKKEGEGGMQGREPGWAPAAPPDPPALSLALGAEERGKEPDPEARKGEEEVEIRRLQEHLEQYPAEKRQKVAEHLVLRGRSFHLVERALVRANGGAS